MPHWVRTVARDASPDLYKMLPLPMLLGVRIHTLTDRREVSEPWNTFRLPASVAQP
jgi:hypothetical protein